MRNSPGGSAAGSAAQSHIAGSSPRPSSTRPMPPSIAGRRHTLAASAANRHAATQLATGGGWDCTQPASADFTSGVIGMADPAPAGANISLTCIATTLHAPGWHPCTPAPSRSQSRCRRSILFVIGAGVIGAGVFGAGIRARGAIDQAQPGGDAACLWITCNEGTLKPKAGLARIARLRP